MCTGVIEARGAFEDQVPGERTVRRHSRWLEGFETGRQLTRQDLRSGEKELEVGRGRPKRRAFRECVRRAREEWETLG